MYLHELKLWNFRKYGGKGDLVNEKNIIREPDLKVQFQNGLNVFIGENDSGKTAIIDSITLSK
jgi:putative ATP-dependent endonuclease of OLD family